jgi:hypothetical protein
MTGHTGTVARLASACLVSLVLGCGDGESARPATPAHPWIKPPPRLEPGTVTLPGWLVYRVDPRVLDEALAELGQEAYIQISPSMASRYAQQAIHVPMEMRAFLVRALDAGGSTLEVVQSTAGLWLRTIGGDARSLRAHPVVVLLDPTPVEIYVTVEPAPDRS